MNTSCIQEFKTSSEANQTLSGLILVSSQTPACMAAWPSHYPTCSSGEGQILIFFVLLYPRIEICLQWEPRVI